MSLIKTKSFQLAIYEKGDRNSSKLALLLPGRLDTKDYPHMRSHVDYLSSKGFYAVSFDPPGTWGSAGDIALYSMTNYLKAIDQLVKHFGKRPTLLMGHSRGGSMAMLAGSRNKHITGIVSVFSSAEPSTTPEGLRPGQTKGSDRDVPGKPNEKKHFELPYSYFKDSMSYDISSEITKTTKPKLFFLGTQDKLVEPDDIRKTFNESLEPKYLVELNSGHDYRLDSKLIDKVNKHLGRFLNSI